MSPFYLGGQMFMSGSASISAPTLTALSSPLLAQATGGGQPITLAGTNLSGVTGVTIGAASATSVSSTSLSVTFTPPVNTQSATPYNISATTAGGTATLIGALYSLPATTTGGSLVAAWYAAEGWGTNTWKDLIGGITLGLAGTYTDPPTLNASWTNGQPGINFVPGVNGQSLINQTQPVISATVGHILFFGDMSQPAPVATYQLPFDSGSPTSAGNQWTAYCLNGRNIRTYQGTDAATTKTFSATPQWTEFYYDGATALGSYVNINNGNTPYNVTLSDVGFTGFTIGGRYSGPGFGWAGNIGLMMIYTGTLSSGDLIILNNIVTAIYA